ncbi:MAG: GNAT family N-acetyltransferase [Chlamydiales bacterium]|nr:GNAT family N-acetyltransferase [Chlamydiales bacterium]
MIRLKSKALQSELVVLRESCEIKEKNQYIVIRSLRNPYFHWGNFLIFNRAPKKNDLPKWEEYFCAEFPQFIHQHRAFTWIKGDDFPNFAIFGYEIERLACLRAQDLRHAGQINSNIIIRRIHADEDWLALEKKQAVRLHSEEDDPGVLNFKKQRLKDYKLLVDKGLGDWFIADLEGRWVGDLGIFYGENMARFQKVTTYPGFEGQGIAHALVYGSAKYAVENYPVEELVIVTVENSRAQKIYQNLGFKLIEKRTNLHRSFQL